ncbi:uncharacterized protein ACA1_258530 [Acanthamoeba castellanii str. Neff]|uniref:THH1/TOM1/TOM3 domain-containing protein n=1 Tax=Acanthamoeba castellanii (strain ATCC 30010 / Neff) TaxID=1257118 RepID=L8GHF1_ACACF|nr:uncharacterized protein ACA1_258530 [Acanthamoeba castellanii str. Neff]ELR11591.1 hypothetical protein ACA1_258530 [Acanthamoeba castellanii str. Neff]
MYNTHLLRSTISLSFVFALFHLLLFSSSTPSDAAAITGHLLTSRTISDVGVSSTYEFLDVLFDGPVFLQDFGVYACSVSPATDNPECSALCSTPAPTTCSQPNFTCLNLTQGTQLSSFPASIGNTGLKHAPATYSATLQAGEEVNLEVLVPPCTSLAIALVMSSGDADIYATNDAALLPSPSQSYWQSHQRGGLTELLFLCCRQSGYNPFMNGPLFLNIPAITNVTFSLYVYGTAKLECPGLKTCETTAKDSPESCEATYTTLLMPTADSAASAFSIPLYEPVPGVTFETVPSKFSMSRVMYGVGINGQVNTVYDVSLAQCNISFVDVVDANGTLVTDVLVQPEVSYPDCSQAKFQEAKQKLQNMSTSYDNVDSFEDFHDLVLRVNAFAVSDGWVGCQRLVDTEFIEEAGHVSVTEFTTRCGSTDPASNSSADPCCNFLEEWSGVCERKEMTYDRTQFRAKKATVADSCSGTAGCTYLALEDYAHAKQYEDDPTRNCAASFFDSVTSAYRVSNPALDCATKHYGSYCDSDGDCLFGSRCTEFHTCTIACVSDSDCAGNQTCLFSKCSTPKDQTARLDLIAEVLHHPKQCMRNLCNLITHIDQRQCVVDGMDEKEKQYYRSLWDLPDNKTNITFGYNAANETNNKDAFLATYKDHLASPTCVGGSNIEEYFLTGGCDTHNCNWAACQLYPELGRGDYNVAYEPQGVCANYGAAGTNNILQECALVGVSEQACMQAFCSVFKYVRDENGQDKLVCDEFCYSGSTLLDTEDECHNATLCKAVNNLATDADCLWNPMVQVCMLRHSRTYSDCVNAGDGWSWALHYEYGAYQDQATCEVGTCHPYLTADKCTNETQCNAAGLCDDALELANPYYTSVDFQPIDGVCVYPFKLINDQYGVVPSCPTYTQKGNIGCLDYYIASEAECLARQLDYGEPRWVRPAANRSECEAYGEGCLEPRYTYLQGAVGLPGQDFLSPKNASECQAVGGTAVPYYRWRQGQWFEGGRWQELSWQARAWKEMNKAVEPYFSTFNQMNQHTAAHYSDLAILEKSDQACRISSGAARTCSGTAFELTIPGTASIAWDDTLQLSPDCVDLTTYSVPAAQLFKEEETTFVANIFVKTITNNAEGYEFENSHDVVVGQLIGDGLFIQLEADGEQAKITSPNAGNVRICLYRREDIELNSNFGVYDFALSDAGDLSRWAPLGVAITLADGGRALCGVLPYPLPATFPTYFPIQRIDDWEGKTFIESQSDATVGMFYLAVALYALLLIPNTLAIVNQIFLFIKVEWPDAGDKNVSSFLWTFFSMGRIIHTCIEAILILRVIYFAMLPTGVLNDTNVVVYIILGDLPVYLFLSIYTLLLFFWVELVHWTLKKGGPTMLKRMKIMFALVNAFIYLFLIVLIIIFISLQASTSSTDTSCSTSYFIDGGDPNSDLKDARKALAILYQSVIIFIALCLALAFLVYGSVVIWMLAHVKAMSEKLAKLKRNKMIKFSVVLVICTVALLGMCAFLLYGTIDQNVNAIGAIVFVIVVEITPLLLLIFTVYAKRTNVFSFWYSTARGRLSRATTSAGSSSPSAQSSSAIDQSSVEMSSSVRSL